MQVSRSVRSRGLSFPGFLARIIKFLTDRSTANKATILEDVAEREERKMKNRVAYNTHNRAGKRRKGRRIRSGGRGGCCRRTEKPAGVGATVRREIMCHRVGTRHGLDDR